MKYVQQNVVQFNKQTSNLPSIQRMNELTMLIKLFSKGKFIGWAVQGRRALLTLTHSAQTSLDVKDLGNDRNN